MEAPVVQTQEEPERHLTLLGDKLGTKKCHHNGNNGMYSGRRREISVYFKDVVAWKECGQECCNMIYCLNGNCRCK